MNMALHTGLRLVSLVAVPVTLGAWMSSAATRLERIQAVESDDADAVAVASAADEGYCSVELTRVLRRVLTSCGLMESGEVRGCQPLEAAQVATLAGGDFNTLFVPLAERGAIIQYDQDSAELDDADRALLESTFADQRGASWFLVVARSSPEGSVEHNRALSEARGKEVLGFLQERFEDPDLNREVGLLWLGEEFAQLDESFCAWKRSGGEDCNPDELNRSAFISWIDCRL